VDLSGIEPLTSTMRTYFSASRRKQITPD